MHGGVNISQGSPLTLDTQTPKKRSKSPKNVVKYRRFFVTPLGVITPNIGHPFKGIHRQMAHPLISIEEVHLHVRIDTWQFEVSMQTGVDFQN